MSKESWKEVAWDKLLKLVWDNRSKDSHIIEYTKKELEPILEPFTKSGQGEIRIFHSSSQKVKAVQMRKVMKVPISREKWALVKRPPEMIFKVPSEEVVFKKVNDLTPGMKAGVQEYMNIKGNPGETMLLAIAKHVGVVADFYGLDSGGIMFTGGRQSAAGTHFVIDGSDLDLSKAQIEIDGAYEWAKQIVIVEVKSSLSQKNFDVNQTLLPLLKWKGLVSDKEVYSMVLLANVDSGNLIYYAYDTVQDTSVSPFGMRISRSKKYIVKV